MLFIPTKRTLLASAFTALFAISASPALAHNHSAKSADKAPFTIDHLAHMANAGNITVSPDGSVTAYTVSKPRNLKAGDDNGSPDTHLFVIRTVNGIQGEPVQFIGTQGSVSALTFSGDGQHIFFKSKRDGDENTSLYSIALAGGEATKRFEYDTSIGDYAVSDDGNTLYFVARPKDETPDLSKKGFAAYAYEEDVRLASLWQVALNEKDAQATVLLDGGHVSNFELSNDGKHITAAVAPTNLVDDSLMRRDLVILETATGKVKQHIDIPGKLGAFEFSDDDKHLAFLAGTDVHDTATGVLFIAKTNSNEFTRLTPDTLQHIQDIDWYNGDILAVAHRGVETELVVYDTKGNEKTILPTPDDIAVRAADIGGTGSSKVIRFIADSPKHPREVFAVTANGTEKLSHHNVWLDGVKLAEQTTFSYEARDGRNIEGLLITPHGDVPKGGWPLILTVHGGPEAHFSDGWITRYSNPGQFGATQGYAVYYPNYRGSTGRGVAFAKEHQNDYAGKEFNDLVDGVDALVKAGIVNRDRVGITGGSYGGYASMWGATAQSEHFAASVAFVGISNQVSKFGTSDIPNEMHLVHSLKWPWEDNWMNLMKRSPLYHVGKSTTPTLILHGEKDTRVHPSQSMELFRSMKVRTQTPVRLVFYPNEGHGNRKAASQYDYALRLMRWMNTYLAADASRTDAMPEFDLDIESLLNGDDEEKSDD